MEKNRIIAIGDTHGRDTWKRIVEQEPSADKEVFIGDYWDSFDVLFEQQLENFVAILKYKRENPERVILLTGNHDFHYLSDMTERYSGYQSDKASLIEPLVASAIQCGDMQAAYSNSGYLFTHAGVTQTWCQEKGIKGSPAEINALLLKKPSAFKFYKGDKSGCGEHISQSPIWVRPQMLIEDPLFGIGQVVGHTQQHGIKYYDGSKPLRLILIDAIHDGQYLIINDGEPKTGYVEA